MTTIIASEIKRELEKKGRGGAGKSGEDGDSRVPHTALAMAELRQGQQACEGTRTEV